MAFPRTVAAALACTLASSLALADARTDSRMIKLATDSGCTTCHSIEPGKPGPEGLKPIGPAWTDVARQYRGKPTASQFLTRVVLEGTSPYASHWKDQVSGLAMPPNAVAVSEGNVRQLIGWILAL